MTTKRRFRVDDLEGVDGYKLATGLIVPRPIGWIGSLSADGVANVAPYSFFNVVSGLPPTFVFSPGRGGRKASSGPSAARAPRPLIHGAPTDTRTSTWANGIAF